MRRLFVIAALCLSFAPRQYLEAAEPTDAQRLLGEGEQLFAAGEEKLKSPPTDMYSLSQQVIEEHRPMFADASFRNRVKGMRLLVASSDVHEHAAGALAQLLDEAGAEVTYLGAEQDPASLVAALRQQRADALLLSTHNGMALEYAGQLKQLLEAESMLPDPVDAGGTHAHWVAGPPTQCCRPPNAKAGSPANIRKIRFTAGIFVSPSPLQQAQSRSIRRVFRRAPIG